MEHIRLPDAAGRTLLAWKADGRELIVRFKGDPAERTLECVCGRRHWIVREQFRGPAARFRVTCHGCGRSGSFPIEGAVLPTR